MDINLITTSNIHSLTYKDLLKISSKYKIYKRWPKKNDLIRDIIEFKEKSDDNIKWQDASAMLEKQAADAENTNHNRLTFTIEHVNRTTFTVPQPDGRTTITLISKPQKDTQEEASKIKKLTVPYSPIKSRSRTLHLSEKSIGIRKSTTAANQKTAIVKKAVKTIDDLGTTNRRKSKSHDGTPMATTTPHTIKARKMPNFTKLHEQEFEKMTSLDDYVRKKATRARMMSAPVTLLHPSEKSNKTKTPIGAYDGRYSRIIMKSPADDGNQVEPKTTPKKDTSKTVKFRSKTPSKTPMKTLTTPLKRAQTDLKINSRQILNGIRSNRRFELQMKFRNCP